MVEKNLIIDNIYISPYEKYAVLYANTFITIFDMEENKLFRVNYICIFDYLFISS